MKTVPDRKPLVLAPPTAFAASGTENDPEFRPPVEAKVPLKHPVAPVVMVVPVNVVPLTLARTTPPMVRLPPTLADAGVNAVTVPQICRDGVVALLVVTVPLEI
jgi:hypothetical protein